MTDDEHAEPQEAPQEASVWLDQGEHLAYANVLAINSGAFDVTLVFGRQDQPVPTHPGNVAPVREVVRVAMSWGHAKSMIPLLAKIVTDYESRFGEIPAPGFGESWKL
jgi:Protein of unknown function (DUF3467)